MGSDGKVIAAGDAGLIESIVATLA